MSGEATGSAVESVSQRPKGLFRIGRFRDDDILHG
jgi:hypothetical protein